MIRADGFREYNQLAAKATYGKLTGSERARMSLLADRLGFGVDHSVPKSPRKQTRKGNTTAYTTYRASDTKRKYSESRRTLW